MATAERRPTVAAAIRRPLGRIVSLSVILGAGGGKVGASPSEVAVTVAPMAGLALAASYFYSLSYNRRKRTISPHFWRCLFTPDGRICDPISFLKKVSKGVQYHTHSALPYKPAFYYFFEALDSLIIDYQLLLLWKLLERLKVMFGFLTKVSVWEVVHLCYFLNSLKNEKLAIQLQKRKNFYRLRRLCKSMHIQSDENLAKLKELTKHTKEGVVTESEDAEKSGLTCGVQLVRV